MPGGSGKDMEALNQKGKLSAIKKAEADACFREFVSQKERICFEYWNSVLNIRIFVVSLSYDN